MIALHWITIADHPLNNTCYHLVVRVSASTWS